MRHIAQRRHSTVSKCFVPPGGGFPKAKGMEARRVRTHRVNDLNLRGCYVGIVRFDGGRSALSSGWISSKARGTHPLTKGSE